MSSVCFEPEGSSSGRRPVDRRVYSKTLLYLVDCLYWCM